MSTATGSVLPAPKDDQWYPIRNTDQYPLRRRARRSMRLSAQRAVPIQYELFGPTPEPAVRPIGPFLIATIAMLALLFGTLRLLDVFVEFAMGWLA